MRRRLKVSSPSSWIPDRMCALYPRPRHCEMPKAQGLGQCLRVPWSGWTLRFIRGGRTPKSWDRLRGSAGNRDHRHGTRFIRIQIVSRVLWFAQRWRGQGDWLPDGMPVPAVGLWELSHSGDRHRHGEQHAVPEPVPFAGTQTKTARARINLDAYCRMNGERALSSHHPSSSPSGERAESYCPVPSESRTLPAPADAAVATRRPASSTCRMRRLHRPSTSTSSSTAGCGIPSLASERSSAFAITGPKRGRK